MDITGFFYRNVKPGEKPSSRSGGTYKRIPINTLKELSDDIESRSSHGYILSQLVPRFPTNGTIRTGVGGTLESAAYEELSTVHFIDMDDHKVLNSGASITIADGKRMIPTSLSHLVPYIIDEAKLKTWLRRTLNITSDYETLITRSHSMMANPDNPRKRYHVYVRFDKPISRREFLIGLGQRLEKDQSYEGLSNQGPVVKHPFIDLAGPQRSKVVNEWTGEENPIVSYNEGRPLVSKTWATTTTIKKNPNLPIKVYTPEDLNLLNIWILESKSLRKHKAEAKGLKYNEHIFESGGEIAFDHAIFKGGEIIGQAGDWLNPDNDRPKNVDSLLDPDDQSGHMYWANQLGCFIDHSSGANLFYAVQPFTNEIHIKGKYIDLTMIPKSDAKVKLITSDPGTGKTTAALSTDVSMFSPYTGGILVVPTHTLAQGVMKHYPEVVRVVSGTKSSDHWDKIGEYKWAVMTYDKFIYEIDKNGETVDGKLVIFDEIHTRLTSKTYTNRIVQQIYRGELDIGFKELWLMTATIKPNTLLIEDLAIHKFVTDERTTAVAVRVLPYDDLIKAERGFVFVEDRGKAAILAEWLKSMGRRATVVHGKNVENEEGDWITHIDDGIEDNFDFILATSALREGFSLTHHYDLIVLDNTVRPQGAQGIAQALKRVRRHCDNIYVKIAKGHFVKGKEKKAPILAKYTTVAKYSGLPLDYDTLKYMKLEKDIIMQNFIDEESGIVKIDPLGSMVLFNEHDMASEKSSFELMANTLDSYGIEIIDEYSLDDDLTGEEIIYEEARLRGAFEPIYSMHVATSTEFKKELKECCSKEELEALLNESSDLLYIQQLQKKIKAEPYRDTVMEAAGEQIIKEVYAVKARTTPTIEEKIRHHEKAIAIGIYDRAHKLIDLDVKYTTQQIVTKVNGFWKTDHVKKTNLKDVLKQFCQFEMYDESGQPMKNYKADKVKHWVIRSLALFDEEISIPRAGMVFTPSLI